MTLKFYSFTTVTLLLGLSYLPAFSQKLPSAQENSLIAPANIKIDGKNKEWSTGLQAYNKSTNLQYAICNDEKNLYLIVKSTDVLNNRKILAGGITFGVNTDGKKNEKESIQLTFPVITASAGFRGGRGGGGGGFGGGGRGQRGGGQGRGQGKAIREYARERDSIMAAGQRSQLLQAKEIKLKGFKNTADSVVSIYNEFGIKAFASIDGENAFFYEAAVPFEALGITKGYSGVLAYQIRLNGLQLQDFNGGGDPEMTSPTDFWGKYTLATK